MPPTCHLRANPTSSQETVVVSVRLYAGDSPYALCTKQAGDTDFAFQSHVLAYAYHEPPHPPPPPLLPPPPSSPNVGIATREFLLFLLPYATLLLLLAALAAAALYYTAAEGDPHKFQKLVEEGAATASTGMSRAMQTSGTFLSRLSPTRDNSPIRNLNADLAEEAGIKALTLTQKSSPSPARVSFSQAPRRFQAFDLALPCACALVVFFVAFVLFVLLPSLSFGMDLVSGELGEISPAT